MSWHFTVTHTFQWNTLVVTEDRRVRPLVKQLKAKNETQFYHSRNNFQENFTRRQPGHRVIWTVLKWVLTINCPLKNQMKLGKQMLKLEKDRKWWLCFKRFSQHLSLLIHLRSIWFNLPFLFHSVFFLLFKPLHITFFFFLLIFHLVENVS